MPSLLEIKKKIQSTKNTKKITRAMQLVAASKMKTFQQKSAHARVYARGLLHALRLTGGSILETSYGTRRSEGGSLFVILTSDKGLCGAMNTKLVRKLLTSEEWKETPENERMVITVGRKSADALRAQGVETIDRFDSLPENLGTLEALDVIASVIDRWDKGDVQKVYLISPWYVNPFVFHPRVKKYLPLSEEMIRSQLVVEGEETEDLGEVPVEAAFMEPSRETLVHTLSQRVVESLFMESFYELKATEYSSRMVAMKKATEAADDRINEYTRLYNKARQNTITQSLAELAGASEAMSTTDQFEIFET